MRRLAGSAWLVLCVACGSDAPFDGGPVDITGNWTTHVSGFQILNAAQQVVTCSATWIMPIDTATGFPAGSLASAVPLEAQQTCEDGSSDHFEYWGMGLVAYHHEDSVIFLTASRLDTFIVAVLKSDNRMEGRMDPYFVGGGEVTATR